MTNQRYFTPEELAAHFENKVSVRTLANWRYLGISPPFEKINGKVLYPVDKLEDWKKRNTHTGTSTYRR